MYIVIWVPFFQFVLSLVFFFSLFFFFLFFLCVCFCFVFVFVFVCSLGENWAAFSAAPVSVNTLQFFACVM